MQGSLEEFLEGLLEGLLQALLQELLGANISRQGEFHTLPPFLKYFAHSGRPNAFDELQFTGRI